MFEYLPLYSEKISHQLGMMQREHGQIIVSPFELLYLSFSFNASMGGRMQIFLTRFGERAIFLGWTPRPMAGYHSSFFGDTHP